MSNYPYLKASQLSGIPFTVLEKPIRVFTPSNEYKVNKVVAQNAELPDFFNAYLIDEEKKPWDMVLDADGKEVHNLICFSMERKNCVVVFDGERREATSMDFNFFNWPTAKAVDNGDGTFTEQRWKLLETKYRAKIILQTTPNLPVKDRKTGIVSSVPVRSAKLDLPQGLWSKKLMDALENTRETLGRASEQVAFPEWEFSFEYDEKKPIPDMYGKVKAKPSKKLVDAAEELKAFVYVPRDNSYNEARAVFEPPVAPF